MIEAGVQDHSADCAGVSPLALQDSAEPPDWWRGGSILFVAWDTGSEEKTMFILQWKSAFKNNTFVYFFLTALGLCYCMQPFSAAACGLEGMGSVVVQLIVPQHVASCQTRRQTRVLCIGRWVLHHWTTRKVKTFLFLKFTTVNNHFKLAFAFQCFVAHFFTEVYIRGFYKRTYALVLQKKLYPGWLTESRLFNAG